MELPPDVAEQVGRLNRILRSQRTLSTKLEAVAQLVQRIVPGCDGASVALVVGDATITGASSSQLAIEADMVQYRHDEGPCLSAVDDRSTVRIDLVSHDERFEHFAPGAIEVGVESVLSIPLMSGDEGVGSINLYSTRPGAFSEQAPGLIGDLAEYATSLIVGSTLYESTVDLLARLVEVIDDSDQVAIAIGILVVRDHLTSVQAWEQLSSVAEEHGESVIEAARRLIGRFERRGEDP